MGEAHFATLLIFHPYRPTPSTNHLDDVMLPAGFYLGNATTILLRLFQAVPHEVLLCMICTAAAFFGLVVLSLMFILVYCGLSCCFRVVRLSTLLAAYLCERTRTTLFRGKAPSGASTVLARRETEPQPLALDPLILSDPPSGETLRTPPALAQIGAPSSLSDRPPQFELPQTPTVRALPAPPLSRRSQRHRRRRAPSSE